MTRVTNFLHLNLFTWRTLPLGLLSLLLALVVATSAARAQSYSPEEFSVQATEDNSGYDMWQAWQTLSKYSADKLKDFSANPAEIPADLKTALESTLRWAGKLDAEEIDVRNPFSATKRYLSDSIRCVSVKDWLIENRDQTSALWQYLLDNHLVNDNMRETAESIVAMTNAPILLLREQDFTPYRDLKPFGGILANPKRLPSCGLPRGTSIYQMLVTHYIPQAALIDLNLALAKQVLRGDFEAIRHLAWLAHIYYVSSLDRV